MINGDTRSLDYSSMLALVGPLRFPVTGLELYTGLSRDQKTSGLLQVPKLGYWFGV